MIRFQILERPETNLHKVLVAAMRSGDLRTFRALKRGRKVEHASHPGWMNWTHADGVITCEVKSPSRMPGTEWRLFHAFLGRLADRYADSIVGINVQFPGAVPSTPAARPRKRTRAAKKKRAAPRKTRARATARRTATRARGTARRTASRAHARGKTVRARARRTAARRKPARATARRTTARATRR